MPHQCVSCGSKLEDGSNEVFDGCPECGGLKFEFVKPNNTSTDEQTSETQGSTGKGAVVVEPVEKELDQDTDLESAEEIKKRLMNQFESIRIIEPGSYELNLMNLYTKDEKIIALQEDGRYKVALPSTLSD